MDTLLAYVGLFGPIGFALAVICGGVMIKRAKSAKSEVTYERQI